MTFDYSKFNDIRPYLDDEIPAVMKRLATNSLLISTARMIVFPSCPVWLKGVVDFFLKRFFSYILNKIKTVQEFQVRIIGNLFMKWVINKSTNGVTSAGMEYLSKDKAYIFISNHRDIALDSALIDYVLHHAGYGIPYIAFGDNLLMNDLVSDLIKVNKSFTVKRDLPPREQFKALMHLSEYINRIHQNGEHFWIAQKEGRAKDGIDITNPAIVKMFHLSERKQQPDFAAFIKSLNIVPVAISYEKDPCDRIKAWELYRKNKKGEHKKKKNEDLISIAAGITGNKGRIHINFSPPLEADFNNEKQVALALDKAIHSHYKLWPGNYIAYDETYETDKYSTQYTETEKANYLAQYQNLKQEVRHVLLKTHANPVLSFESLKDT
ncbi:1-acyl-sn-glycerol-3-phosphate acyltransferase [bacterium]|nr:1-acyl-sn-glycerol-3-phosphate acyltransferase [bacterium]